MRLYTFALFLAFAQIVPAQDKTLGGHKKVDSSTHEKRNSSIEAIRSSLNDEKKSEFERALHVLVISEFSNIFDVEVINEGLRKLGYSLHGKTADEIITEEKKAREQVLSKIEEIKTMIAELERKRSEAENAKEGLKKLNVVSSRFYFQKSSLKGKPVIELTVKNKTQHAISRAYFHGVLSSPRRSVPWIQGSFNYKISGGLEPGEQVTWKLSSNMFGEWSKAPRDRKDMVLTVAVIRIDGADEKSFYDSKFSKGDLDLLKALNNMLIVIEKVTQN